MNLIIKKIDEPLKSIEEWNQCGYYINPEDNNIVKIVLDYNSKKIAFSLETLVLLNLREFYRTYAKITKLEVDLIPGKKEFKPGELRPGVVISGGVPFIIADAQNMMDLYPDGVCYTTFDPSSAMCRLGRHFPTTNSVEQLELTWS